MIGRTQGHKLKPEEIAKLRACYDAGFPGFKAASEVGCTRRTANKYYMVFRGYKLRVGRPKGIKLVPLPPAPPPEPKSRFYTSNFEL